MSKTRGLGLILSVLGVGLALSKSIELQTMDSLTHPSIVWYLAAAGFVGTVIYFIGAWRENKRGMGSIWATMMIACLLLVAIVMPPLPTANLYEKARRGDENALYWVQLYTHPDYPPLRMSGGAVQ